jgi:hypothetical protein
MGSVLRVMVVVMALCSPVWASEIQVTFSDSYTQQQKDCVLAAVADWQAGIQDNLVFANISMEIGSDISGLAGTLVTQVSSDGSVNMTPPPWDPEVYVRIQVNTSYVAQISFDPDGPVPANKFDGLTIFRHEFAHALGFNDWYFGLSRNLTTEPGGGRTYQGVDFTVGLTPESQGVHVSDSLYPNDLMMAGIAPGTRTGISELDLRVLTDAYGYTTPEPSTLLLLSFSAMFALRTRWGIRCPRGNECGRDTRTAFPVAGNGRAGRRTVGMR